MLRAGRPLPGRAPLQRRRGARQRAPLDLGRGAAACCPACSRWTRRGRTRSGSSSSVRSRTCRAGSRDPRLGIVSPQALQPAVGRGRPLPRPRARAAAPAPSSCGRARRSEIELTRTAALVGDGRGPRPGARRGRVHRRARPRSERLELLRAGTAQVAEPLDRRRRGGGRSRPAARGGHGRRGAGRAWRPRCGDSRRGSAVPALSGVWLTTARAVSRRPGPPPAPPPRRAAPRTRRSRAAGRARRSRLPNGVSSMLRRIGAGAAGLLDRVDHLGLGLEHLVAQRVVERLAREPDQPEPEEVVEVGGDVVEVAAAGLGADHVQPRRDQLGGGVQRQQPERMSTEGCGPSSASSRRIRPSSGARSSRMRA